MNQWISSDSVESGFTLSAREHQCLCNRAPDPLPEPSLAFILVFPRTQMKETHSINTAFIWWFLLTSACGFHVCVSIQSKCQFLTYSNITYYSRIISIRLYSSELWNLLISASISTLDWLSKNLQFSFIHKFLFSKQKYVLRTLFLNVLLNVTNIQCFTFFKTLMLKKHSVSSFFRRYGNVTFEQVETFKNVQLKCFRKMFHERCINNIFCANAFRTLLQTR